MAAGPRIALFGEGMIELRGEAFGVTPHGFGGDTLNTAIYLARLSHEIDLEIFYATALGTDPFSDHMIRAWQGEGIDTALVLRLEGALPGLYAIQLDSAGERRFFYWRDASAARRYFDGAETPLEQAAGTLTALYLSGISLAILPPAARERLIAVLAQVRAGGGRVVFDNNFRPPLWPNLTEARRWYEQTYALSDIALITLDDEMALRGQASAEQALADALALGVAEAVIKRGAQPTLVSLAGTLTDTVPVEPVPRVVDTTAAGDSFAGAYLAMRMAEVEPAAAARAANRMAAVVIQHPGAIIPQEAMPTRAALLAREPTPTMTPWSSREERE